MNARRKSMKGRGGGHGLNLGLRFAEWEGGWRLRGARGGCSAGVWGGEGGKGWARCCARAFRRGNSESINVF